MKAHFTARIRPTSKYAAQDTGTPFAVRLNEYPASGYLWQGGPGGQYRHSDLQLFTVDGDGQQVPVSLFAKGDERAYLQIICNDYQQAAHAGHIDPDHFGHWANSVIEQLNRITDTARETYKDDE